MTGRFVFFDHMGPVDFPPGIPPSVDVRPHPHISLATLTDLFDGEIMHRDSVGSEQPIRRIEQAKADWRAGRMQLPHLDDAEFIPLPPGPRAPANPMS